MLRLAFDADVPHAIVRGLIRREPGLDLVRIQDVGLRKAADAVILEWAANSNRVLVSRDINTMTDCAYDRVRHGLPMSGVLILKPYTPHGRAIDEVLLAAVCFADEDIMNRVEFLPFP